MDVYGLQILDATLDTGKVEEDTAASALLLKHEFLDGGADDVTLATLGRGAAGAHARHARQFSGALQQPELRGLGQLHGGRLEGYAMTLSAFAWNIARTYTLTPGRRYSFGCRYSRAESHFGAFGGLIPGLVQQSAGTFYTFLQCGTVWPLHQAPAVA